MQFFGQGPNEWMETRRYNPRADPVNYLKNIGRGWYDSVTDLPDMFRRQRWERDAAINPYNVPDYVPAHRVPQYANALLQQRNEARNALANLQMKQDRRTLAKYPGGEGYSTGNALSYALDPVGDMMGGPIGAMAAKGLSTVPWGALAAMVPMDIPRILKNTYNASGDQGLKLYHGSNAQWKNGEFDYKMIGKKRGTTEGWGAYWATDKRNAEKFGKNIYELTISPEEVDAFLDYSARYEDQTPYVQEKLKRLITRVRSQKPDDIAYRTQGFLKQPLNTRSGGEVVDGLRRTQYRGEDVVDFVNGIQNEGVRKNYQKALMGEGELTGGDIYGLLVNEAAGYEKEASKYLQQSGVPGLVFPASRDLHSVVPQSPNVIIWDERWLRP